MDTTQGQRRSLASTAMRSISIPALVGASLGAVAAVLLPNGDQGDVMSSTPAASNS